MAIKQFIEKLRSLPEPKRKAIFFTVLGICALALLPFGIWSVKSGLAKLDASSFSFAIPDDLIPKDLSQLVQGGLQEEVAPNETVDWKTYEDKGREFSIKYPKAWETPMVDEGKQEMNFEDRLVINYYENEKALTGGVSFDSWVKFPANGFDASTQEEITIGKDIPAVKVKQSYCNGVPMLTNVVVAGLGTQDAPIYVFRGPVLECGSAKEVVEKEYPEFENIVNLMLSTFNLSK